MRLSTILKCTWIHTELSWTLTCLSEACTIPIRHRIEWFNRSITFEIALKKCHFYTINVEITTFSLDVGVQYDVLNRNSRAIEFLIWNNLNFVWCDFVDINWCQFVILSMLLYDVQQTECVLNVTLNVLYCWFHVWKVCWWFALDDTTTSARWLIHNFTKRSHALH